jgi:hypothetical protein
LGVGEETPDSQDQESLTDEEKLFGDLLEQAIFNAIDQWTNKVKLSFASMIEPLVKAFRSPDESDLAQELKYFVNCDTCGKLVAFIRQPPNDELIVEFIAMTQMNACKAFMSVETCRLLIKTLKQEYLENWFNLLFT